MQSTVRCSPHGLRDIVTRIPEHRKDAIERSGFGPLLNFEGIDIRRRLCQQIADCYNTETGLFEIGGHIIELRLEEVDHMLGLPSTGPLLTVPHEKRVSDLYAEFKWEKKGSYSATFLKTYLKDNIHSDVSDENFARVFIFYCIGFYLCSTHKNSVKSEYLSLLENYEAIPSLNWTSLVHQNLLSSIAKYITEEKANLTGNLALLQVWYWEKFSVTHLDSTFINVGRMKPLMGYCDKNKANKRCEAALFGQGRLIDDITRSMDEAPDTADAECRNIPDASPKLSPPTCSDTSTDDTDQETDQQHVESPTVNSLSNAYIKEKIEKEMKTMRRFIAKKLTPLIDAIDDLQKKDEKNSKRIDALTKNSQIPSPKFTYIPENLHKSQKMYEVNHEDSNKQAKTTKRKETKHFGPKCTFIPDYLQEAYKARQDQMHETTDEIKQASEPKGKRKRRASERASRPIETKNTHFDYTVGTKRRRVSVPLEGYKCTDEDIPTIAYIEESKLPTILVHIKDVQLNKRKMLCLAQKTGWLDDEVITSRIHCLRDKMHPDQREGGRAYLEITIVTHYLVTIDKCPPWMFKKLEEHFNYDMVFLPVNKGNTHWYLAVINVPERRVQILDSFGPTKYEREELIILLNKLEEYYSKIKKPVGCKWKDHFVSDWEQINAIQAALQKDTSSCGLFLLKFIEYWTGKKLSTSFTQDDMDNFRMKLAVLLVDSKLNQIKRDNATNAIPQDQSEVKEIAEDDQTGDKQEDN